MSLTFKKHILVVDDEELMREVVTMMIEEEGGTALAAVDGYEAVEVVRARRAEIGCVLMDFSMPRMNGFEAYCAIREIAPELPVIITSGLKITPEVQELVDRGAVQFLNKPFHQAEIVKALNKAADRPG